MGGLEFEIFMKRSNCAACIVSRFTSVFDQTTVSETGRCLLKADFAYGKDGRFMAKDDLLNNAWDRTMQYDFAGRLTFFDFGMGLAADDHSAGRVYEQSIGQ